MVRLGQNGVYALRAKREHIQEIRRNALPQGISMQEGEIPAGANWWILRNLTASTTCGAVTDALKELGWDASAIRPTGKSAWLVCSMTEPPATHLCIGSDYVAVMPVKSQNTTKPAELQTATVKVGANFSMCPEDMNSCPDVTTPTTVASRVDNIKADLKADLEERLTSMIESRMKECDSKVNELAATVDLVKMEVHDVQSSVDSMKKETKDEIASMRADISSGNSCIMNQMQNLFQKMQSELQNTLGGAKEEHAETEAKRPRL